MSTRQLNLPIPESAPVPTPPTDSVPPPTAYSVLPPPADPARPPVDPLKALRALAERRLEQARDQVARWRSAPGPPWIERELAECEAYIRETSALSGLGLDHEGGMRLAEAKRARRELHRMRDLALEPERRGAVILQAIQGRLATALRRTRGRNASPKDHRALIAAIEALRRPQSAADLDILRAARAHLRAVDAAGPEERAAEGMSVRARRGAAPQPAAGTIAGTEAADAGAELVARYLPAPAEPEFEPEDSGLLGRLAEGRFDPAEDYRLNQSAHRLSLLGGFEVLLCPPLLRGVEHYDYQLNTARQVMRSMRGRALLCDEVGLGKTIEAGLVLKEYLVRGLARRVLILTPPSLVGQWRDEMRDKFDVPFALLEDSEFREHGDEGWERCERVIASIHTAKSPRHAERIRRAAWDLVVVDEAHHLRNRASRSWKFVNQLESRHLLLLTATPAQNDLDELFNLITLLAPGRLRSPAEFRREFVERDDPRRPRNRTKLRELLMDVMVRNTRSQVSVRLPGREAATLSITLGAAERALYDGVSRFVRARYGRAGESRGRIALQALQAEAGSSAAAVRGTLQTMMGKAPPGGPQDELRALMELAEAASGSGKANALVEMLRSRCAPAEKVLVFTHYRRTQAFLAALLEGVGIRTALFHGGLDTAEKDAAIAAFAREVRVLVSTDVGSEGRNLQFCHTIVNYDLPWNPMRIEQRVGRVHRIGQTEPVRIFNLAAADTLEGRILEVLDRKINMFELVVGEIGEILGNLEEEREFEDVVLEAWAGADSDDAAGARIAALGDRLVHARQRYLESKRYDEALFGHDFSAEE